MNNDQDFNRLVGLARQLYQEAEINAAENPTSPTIQIVIVEPFKKPYKETIPNTLEKMQELVGGYIENVFIGENQGGARIGLVVNEEGKLKDLPFNRKILGHTGQYEILVGTIIITAYNMQGDNVSLTDKEAEKYIKRFLPIEIYI